MWWLTFRVLLQKIKKITLNNIDNNDLPGTDSKIVQLNVSLVHKKACFPSMLVFRLHEATDGADTDLTTEILVGEQSCLLWKIVQDTPLSSMIGASQKESNVKSEASKDISNNSNQLISYIKCWFEGFAKLSLISNKFNSTQFNWGWASLVSTFRQATHPPATQPFINAVE